MIKEELIDSLQCAVLGEVTLSGFNGNMSNNKVISLNARMKDNDLTVPIRFVACKNVTQNCLLSLADYRKLLQEQQVCSSTGQTGGLSTGSDDGSLLTLTHCGHTVMRVLRSVQLTLGRTIAEIMMRVIHEMKMKFRTSYC